MHLHFKYQNPKTLGSKDKVVQNYVKVPRSQGPTSGNQKKGLFIMHLYLKYQNPNTFGSIDIAQSKVFKTTSKFKMKVTRSKVVVPKERSLHNASIS
jgi:hypothetical protein